MDDRAAITALLHVARRLSEQGDPPAGDGYLVFTTNGELCLPTLSTHGYEVSSATRSLR
jgi:putative aminopeptidase FrvX